jgi:hypothetical protein
MQTGTIDGLENPLPDAISAKFYEVSKQVVLTGHQVANVFFTFAKPFWDGLSEDERKAISAAEDTAKKVNDDGVLATEAEGKAFFEALLQITMEGFFADPIYGGNRNKASWRMIGFPGLPAVYSKLIEEYRNKRYAPEPQSIADFS